MSRWLDVYAAFMRTSLAANIQYRASGAIWTVGMILEPVVFLVVWSTVARSEGGSVADLEPRDFAAYYIAMLLANHLTFSWVMHTFELRIRSGELAFELLRPLHPIHADVADNVTYKLVMSVLLLPSLAVLVWLFEPRFELVPWALALALPAIVLALGIRILLDWILGLAAFWTTRVTALNQAYFSVALFLSGRFAPMAVLPGWVQDTARALPFYWTLAFPVELALGRLSAGEALQGIGVQAFWVALTLLAVWGLWRRAVRHFTAVGS